MGWEMEGELANSIQAVHHSDRRRSPRFDLDMTLRVRPANDQSGVVQGRILDLSRGGMNALIFAELELGESIVLEFVLPYVFTCVRLEAVIRRRDRYRYGLEFVNVTDSDRAKINRASVILAMLQQSE